MEVEFYRSHSHRRIGILLARPRPTSDRRPPHWEYNFMDSWIRSLHSNLGHCNPKTTPLYLQCHQRPLERRDGPVELPSWRRSIRDKLLPRSVCQGLEHFLRGMCGFRVNWRFRHRLHVPRPRLGGDRCVALGHRTRHYPRPFRRRWLR